MTQEAIQITTTPPLPGLQLVQEINKAFNTVATDFAGPNDPAVLAGPYTKWLDTSTNPPTLRRRNAENSAWEKELGTAATRDVGTGADEVPTNDLLSGFILTPENLADVLNAIGVWVTRAIGEEVWLDDSNPAVEVPPTDSSLFRYIKLTAGENDSGGYNEGVLINENVSGSAPLIEATAEVNLPDSPFHGQTVRLLNTERRFVRAGESGTTQDDAFQGHGHESHSSTHVGGSGSRFVTGDSWARTEVTYDEGRVDKGFGTPRIADENRPRNIGRTVYMRIL